MGCFDSVWVNCPQCNEENEFQSKSGPCIQDNYNLEDCPLDVLANVNRHSPVRCENCRTLFHVDVSARKAIKTELVD